MLICPSTCLLQVYFVSIICCLHVYCLSIARDSGRTPLKISVTVDDKLVPRNYSNEPLKVRQNSKLTFTCELIDLPQGVHTVRFTWILYIYSKNKIYGLREEPSSSDYRSVEVERGLPIVSTFSMAVHSKYFKVMCSVDNHKVQVPLAIQDTPINFLYNRDGEKFSCDSYFFPKPYMMTLTYKANDMKQRFHVLKNEDMNSQTSLVDSKLFFLEYYGLYQCRVSNENISQIASLCLLPKNYNTSADYSNEQIYKGDTFVSVLGDRTLDCNPKLEPTQKCYSDEQCKSASCQDHQCALKTPPIANAICLNDQECDRQIKGSRCINRICKCAVDGGLKTNANGHNVCVGSSQLFGSCDSDGFCAVENSVCSEGKCICENGYVARMNNCVWNSGALSKSKLYLIIGVAACVFVFIVVIIIMLVMRKVNLCPLSSEVPEERGDRHQCNSHRRSSSNRRNASTANHIFNSFRNSFRHRTPPPSYSRATRPPSYVEALEMESAIRRRSELTIISNSMENQQTDVIEQIYEASVSDQTRGNATSSRESVLRPNVTDDDDDDNDNDNLRQGRDDVCAETLECATSLNDQDVHTDDEDVKSYNVTTVFRPSLQTINETSETNRTHFEKQIVSSTTDDDDDDVK
ncbi:Uncharacterised protein g9259 [Pycnogonum litorale]